MTQQKEELDSKVKLGATPSPMLASELVEQMAEWEFNHTGLVSATPFKKLPYFTKKAYLDSARQLITDLKLVQLDEDQSLPKQSYASAAHIGADSYGGYKDAQQTMLNAKFKKVKG